MLRKILFFLLLIDFSILCTATAKSNYAVLVGISRRQGELADSEPYAVNDVNDMYEYLTHNANWNVTNLTNSNATRNAIVNAVVNMKNAASTGDLCIFMFSGSGSSNGALLTYENNQAILVAK